MKIYTRTGDKGETALYGGRRVSKADPRINAYGTIDELNSWIGFIASDEVEVKTRVFLYKIQRELFNIGAHLAADPAKNLKLPEYDRRLAMEMENAIDNMNEMLPELKNFILPGGSGLTGKIHIARCVCRRAERRIVELDSSANHEIVILNRLSDYLFVLARYVGHRKNLDEIPWKPGDKQ